MATQDKPYQPPYTLYLAPPGTAEPDLDYTGDPLVLSAPAAEWVEITEKPLGEEAIQWMLTQTESDQDPSVNDVWSARSYREKMEASITVMLPDFDGVIVAKFFGQTVTTTAKTSTAHGFRKFSLDPGQTIEHFSLLVRASSCHDVAGTIKLPRQWWFPLVKEANGITTTFGRKHAEFEAKFMVYKHPTLGVGSWIEAHDPGGP